jgi:hypothetical protein
MISEIHRQARDGTQAAAPASDIPAVLQVFNQYLEPGGEESWFNTLAKEPGLPGCVFRSADWRGPDAPAAWRQALLMVRNPQSCARLLARHSETGAKAWLFHNVFPVGSAGLYAEGLRLGVPVIQYVHSFRPFSISGYLSGGEADDLGRWPGTYWREIRRGAWQNSRVKTAWYAAVLTLTRTLGWFRAIKAWIAVSDFMRDKFISAGVPAKDIFTLRHFWHPMTDSPTRQDDGYYVFLGRLVEMKGVKVLLEAWDQLLREQGTRAPKLMIAGDGELAPLVIAKTRENPLISYLGHVSGEEKSRLLRDCSAVIAPSLCLESLGLVTYEAYDFGKPMLVARSGGLAETVSHGVTGLIHDAGDATGLARQVLELDSNPRQRREMGAAGRAWLLENTSYSKWRRDFDRVVEHAVAGRRVSG